MFRADDPFELLDASARRSLRLWTTWSLFSMSASSDRGLHPRSNDPCDSLPRFFQADLKRLVCHRP